MWEPAQSKLMIQAIFFVRVSFSFQSLNILDIVRSMTQRGRNVLNEHQLHSKVRYYVCMRAETYVTNHTKNDLPPAHIWLLGLPKTCLTTVAAYSSLGIELV